MYRLLWHISTKYVPMLWRHLLGLAPGPSDHGEVGISVTGR
jgi:hypothetical protein